MRDAIMRLRVAISNESDDGIRPCRSQSADGSERAAIECAEDERLVPDEYIQPFEVEVRVQRGGWCIRDLETGEIRRSISERSDHLDRDRVAGSSLELVDVERHRIAGVRRGLQ